MPSLSATLIVMATITCSFSSVLATELMLAIKLIDRYILKIIFVKNNLVHNFQRRQLHFQRPLHMKLNKDDRQCLVVKVRSVK